VTTTGISIVENEPVGPVRRRRSAPRDAEAAVVVAPPPTPEVDRAAFIEQLCGRERDYILKTLLKQRGLSEESAQDLTQVTLLALAVDAAEPGRVRDPRKYVNGIMRNLLRDRHNLRLRTPEIEEGADPDAEVDGGRDPESEAQLAECWAKLERYLDELPKGEAQAFRRVELEGETIEAAADGIGRPRSTVADRLRRAYTKLRARVQDSVRGIQLAAPIDPPDASSGGRATKG
jgi:RNA polymerase sigma factor (sigma-70 family)